VSQGRDDRAEAAQGPREYELRVNPIACDAHGVCIELLPELITADPWGYPRLRPGPVPLRLQALARRAVANCPTLAIVLAECPAGPAEPGQSRVRPDR
jgi:ferredoxin